MSGARWGLQIEQRERARRVGRDMEVRSWKNGSFGKKDWSRKHGICVDDTWWWVEVGRDLKRRRRAAARQAILKIVSKM